MKVAEIRMQRAPHENFHVLLQGNKIAYAVSNGVNEAGDVEEWADEVSAYQRYNEILAIAAVDYGFRVLIEFVGE